MHQQTLQIENRLDSTLQALLVRVIAIAQAQQITLWLVGGVVRDLWLDLPVTYDLDLTVEGDAIALAHALAAALHGQIVATYPPFGTATVAVPNDRTMSAPIQIDLATARTETYPHPAALPVVQPATVAQDLGRRDFSVNAMALSLHTTDGRLTGGPLLDPFEGQRDLAARQLRVLHDRSFDDDPTRILRGLRLAARLGFQLEPHTRALLTAALAEGRLEATSADRVRTELCLALVEPRPDAVLHLSDEWSITSHIFAPLGWSRQLAVRCDQARRLSPYSTLRDPLLYAGLLTYDLAAEERAAFAVRYRLPGDATRLLRELGEVQARRDVLSVQYINNSDLVRLLQPFDEATLQVARAAEAPPVRERITHYLTHLRHVKPLLNGHALQQLGVARGPRVGQLLSELRTARLDGLVTTRADEEALVLARLDAHNER